MKMEAAGIHCSTHETENKRWSKLARTLGSSTREKICDYEEERWHSGVMRICDRISVVYVGKRRERENHIKMKRQRVKGCLAVNFHTKDYEGKAGEGEERVADCENHFCG